jgi:hypothetical protein
MSPHSMSTILTVDGISSTCFPFTLGRNSRWVSEAAHAPLDYVVVMVSENGGCMTHPTPGGLLSEQREA